MKQKVTIYFKPEFHKTPLILHDVSSVDVLHDGMFLRVVKESEFSYCYVIPLENIIYSTTEMDDE